MKRGHNQQQQHFDSHLLGMYFRNMTTHYRHMTAYPHGISGNGVELNFQ